MNLGLLILLGPLAVCGLVAYLWLRSRPPETALSFSARCPRCAQKVRYATSRAGHGAMCPQCGRRWTLPGVPETRRRPDAQEGYRVKRR
jgi:hypothetical protein